MRKTLLTSAAVLGLALAAPAFAPTALAQTGGTAGMGGTSGAGTPDTNPTTGMGNPAVNDQGVTQPAAPRHGNRVMPRSGMTAEGTRPGHEPGVGDSEPMSTRASNIDRADSRSQIAPRLPTPRVGEDAGPEGYVRDAQRALRQNRTGEAQEALERAETRVLDQHQGDQGRIPMMDTLEQARQALGRQDVAGARRILDQSVAENGGPGSAGYRGAPGSPGYSASGPMGGGQVGNGQVGNGQMNSGPMHPPTGALGAMSPAGNTAPGTTR